MYFLKIIVLLKKINNIVTMALKLYNTFGSNNTELETALTVLDNTHVKGLKT